MGLPSWEWDEEAQAGYLKLREVEPGGVGKTIPVDKCESVLLDYDNDGRLVGVEIIGR